MKWIPLVDHEQVSAEVKYFTHEIVAGKQILNSMTSTFIEVGKLLPDENSMDLNIAKN